MLLLLRELRSSVDYNIANVLASLDTHVVLEYRDLKGGNPAIDRLNAKHLSCKFAFLQLNLADLLFILFKNLLLGSRNVSELTGGNCEVKKTRYDGGKNLSDSKPSFHLILRKQHNPMGAFSYPTSHDKPTAVHTRGIAS